jgi:putative endonuclease
MDSRFRRNGKTRALMGGSQYFVYILASKRNGTLYIGMTSNLAKRVYEHKNDLVGGFTKRYSIHNLVYYEMTDDMGSALTKEKQLKKWRRSWKIALIEKQNPKREDLYYELL